MANEYDKIAYHDLLKNLSMFNGKPMDGYDIPVNRYAGFQQTPQDQFVDNRTTSAGEAIIDMRTPRDIAYDNTIQNQGLYDLSLDVAIPGGQAVAGGMRAASGLGLRGLEHMGNLRRSIAAGKASQAPIDEGRRTTMQVGAALAASSAVPLSVKVATSGLGLGDNAVQAIATKAFDPAKTLAQKNLGSNINRQIMMGNSKLFNASEKIPAITKIQKDMATIVDDTLMQAARNGEVVALRGKNGEVLGPHIMKNGKMEPLKKKVVDGEDFFVNPKTGKYEPYYKMDVLEPGDIYRGGTRGGIHRLPDNAVKAMEDAGHGKNKFFDLNAKLQAKKEQGNRIAQKATEKYKRNVKSEQPTMKPKDIHSELTRRQKKLAEAKAANKEAEAFNKTVDDYYKTNKYAEFGPEYQKIINTNSLEKEIASLNRQLDTVAKTGKVSPAKAPKVNPEKVEFDKLYAESRRLAEEGSHKARREWNKVNKKRLNELYRKFEK